jgi:hypothetical protein
MSDGSTPRRWTILRVVKYAAISLLVAAVAVVGWQYWLFKGGIFSTSRFDSEKWKELSFNNDDFSCYRGGMANDLKDRVLLPTMSRASVENLLGKPDRSGVEDLEYTLGMCSGLRIDFDSLNVYFNEHGGLTRVAITQH